MVLSIFISGLLWFVYSLVSNLKGGPLPSKVSTTDAVNMKYYMERYKKEAEDLRKDNDLLRIREDVVKHKTDMELEKALQRNKVRSPICDVFYFILY